MSRGQGTIGQAAASPELVRPQGRASSTPNRLLRQLSGTFALAATSRECRKHPRVLNYSRKLQQHVDLALLVNVSQAHDKRPSPGRMRISSSTVDLADRKLSSSRCLGNHRAAHMARWRLWHIGAQVCGTTPPSHQMTTRTPPDLYSSRTQPKLVLFFDFHIPGRCPQSSSASCSSSR